MTTLDQLAGLRIELADLKDAIASGLLGDWAKAIANAKITRLQALIADLESKLTQSPFAPPAREGLARKARVEFFCLASERSKVPNLTSLACFNAPVDRRNRSSFCSAGEPVRMAR
jgi:hypothetical protein